MVVNGKGISKVLSILMGYFGVFHLGSIYFWGLKLIGRIKSFFQTKSEVATSRRWSVFPSYALQRTRQSEIDERQRRQMMSP